jgi:hypothetical protein
MEKVINVLMFIGGVIFGLIVLTIFASVAAHIAFDTYEEYLKLGI